MSNFRGARSVVAVILAFSGLFVSTYPVSSEPVNTPVIRSVAIECSQPFRPTGYRWDFPSAKGGESAGRIEEVEGEAVRVVLDGSGISGPVPQAPPGVTVPGTLRGTIEIPGIGLFAYHQSLLEPDRWDSPLVIWLVNHDEVLAFEEIGPYADLTRVVRTSDGRLILEASSDTRSGYAKYQWRFDEPCGGVGRADVVRVIPAFTG